MRQHDRVKETTTTTGTGNITLAGAATGFVSFFSRFSLNEQIYYAIAGQSGTEWEVGRGHITNSTTLVRDAVLESSNATGTVAQGNLVYWPVSFSAGTKDVFSTIPAWRVADMYRQGQVNALQAGLAMP